MPYLSKRFLIIITLYFVAAQFLFKELVAQGVPEILMNYMVIPEEYARLVEIALAVVIAILSAATFLLVYILFIRRRSGGGVK